MLFNFRCISSRQFKYAQASIFCNICNVNESALMKNDEFYFDYNIQKVCLALPDFDFLIKASAGL